MNMMKLVNLIKQSMKLLVMDRLKAGDKVRTLKDLKSVKWLPEARERCQWNAVGKVVKVYMLHYKVKHNNNEIAPYERDELELIKPLSRFKMISHEN